VRRESFDRLIFAAAAAFNLGGAALLVFKPEIALARLGIIDPAARLLARSLASSAAAWGVGYALVAFDARRFRNFAWLGAISKTLFAAIYAAAYFNGQVAPAACLPALVDLLFAAFFADFLWRTRRRAGKEKGR
jgi:hypothetical protein